MATWFFICVILEKLNNKHMWEQRNRNSFRLNVYRQLSYMEHKLEQDFVSTIYKLSSRNIAEDEKFDLKDTPSSEWWNKGQS